MNRDRSQDVAALGIVTEQLTEANGFDAATFLCQVHEQEGQHRDGSCVPHFCSTAGESLRSLMNSARSRAASAGRPTLP